LAISRPIFTKI